MALGWQQSFENRRQGSAFWVLYHTLYATMRRMWWVVDCAFLSPEFVVWWSLHASFSCVIVRFIMPVRCCACCSHLAMFLLMGTASTVVKTSIDVAWGVENSVAHFWSPEPECYTWLFERWYEQKICSPANGGDISIWWSIRWLGLCFNGRSRLCFYCFSIDILQPACTTWGQLPASSKQPEAGYLFRLTLP